MIRKLTVSLIVVFALAFLAMPAAAQDYINYVVQPGDTLSKIALRNCTTWTEIYNANAQSIGEDPNNIEPGLHLIVPNRCGATHLPSQPGEQPAGSGDVYDRGENANSTGYVVRANIYYVAWGDTLFSIGRRFGVSVDELRAANGLTEDSVLFATSRIVIPGLNGVYVATQLPLLPGEAPVAPANERGFEIGECRIGVLSEYPARSTPNGEVIAQIPAGEYAAARVSNVAFRDWFQIEYIDTLIWIGDTTERMNLNRIGNCDVDG